MEAHLTMSPYFALNDQNPVSYLEDLLVATGGKKFNELPEQTKVQKAVQHKFWSASDYSTLLWAHKKSNSDAEAWWTEAIKV